jgi:imidazolonepropionase-like amidohydrolase
MTVMRTGRRLPLALLAALTLLAVHPAAAEVVAITGGTVHTMGPAGTIEGGTVLIENGRIRAVGKDIAVPSGARRIDAAGKVVTPGLFDSLSRLGIEEVGAVEESVDSTVNDDRITAANDVADAVNPRSVLIPINRVEGLTRTMTAPKPGKSLIAGLGALLSLDTESPGFLIRPRAALLISLNQTGARLSGGSRSAALLRLREAFQDALDYRANRAAFERGDRRSYALSRLDLEALQPAVQGEMPVVVSVDRASDIEAAMRLAKDFHLKLVLADVTEGWVVAKQIAAAKVPVLINVLNNLPASFDALGATLENAARLQAAGVEVAFQSGESHNARNLKQAAGNAVAYGMPWKAALEAMTTVPAHIWGLADHYGTLEPGKDADVVVWDGDPLEVTTYADHVFIRGTEMLMDDRQIRLRERYKNVAE